ncbi:MAG: hypothetical protein M3Q63_02385 [bacterium]|nr:hypothetical protein [bacterium]
MQPQQYLENKLKNCARYQLSTQDYRDLKTIGNKEFLFKLITRKKFRRWKLPDLARERIDTTLDFCLTHNEPIIFRFRFGGYKLWQLKSAPEVDWAEFFSIAYYSEYLAPIIATHPVGVKLIFVLEDVGIQKMNNISKTDMDSYYESFKRLCVEFEKYIPENFSIQVVRHGSLFNTIEDFEQEFRNKIMEIEETWKEKQSPEYLKSILKAAALNIKWDGVVDLTKISNEDKQKKIEQSAMMHDALVDMPTIRAFSDKNPRIILIFTTPLPKVISIGMTKASIVKFWVGNGVLEEQNGKYLDHILSPSQIEKIKEVSFKEIPINLIQGVNFFMIKLYSKKLELLNIQ